MSVVKPPTAEWLTKNGAARHTLTGELLHRIESLTESEVFFLRALLDDDTGAVAIDGGKDESALDAIIQQTSKLNQASAKLSDEMLFAIPTSDVEQKPPRARRPSTRALWQAHEDGVHPKQLLVSKFPRAHEDGVHQKQLVSKSSLATNPSNQSSREMADGKVNGETSSLEKSQSEDSGINETKVISDLVDGKKQEEEDDDAPSDKEIRSKLGNDSVGSSWDSEDDANHLKFDAWEVLKDEYSEDFGFNYTTPDTSNNGEDDTPNSFQILGTSADDEAVRPHVMSPPMMEALSSFLPDNLVGQNFWLRFSLVRDGASLNTLKRYVRASECTILVIETAKGEVFGSFTSSAWRNNYGFYGSTPAFVWKLRHSRQTKCTSLFDQAKLESEVDVFMASGSSENIQVCRHDGIAVGGDELPVDINDFESLHDAVVAAKNSGFAICLDADLLRGTTSHSSTFHNPSLCGLGDKTEVFEVAGLEVWSMTPCFDVKSAEKVEMTKFFVEGSIRSLSASSTPRNSTRFAIGELDQYQFYQRVGHDQDGASRRDHWQDINAMNAVGKTNRGFGASPRF